MENKIAEQDMLEETFSSLNKIPMSRIIKTYLGNKIGGKSFFSLEIKETDVFQLYISRYIDKILEKLEYYSAEKIYIHYYNRYGGYHTKKTPYSYCMCLVLSGKQIINISNSERILECGNYTPITESSKINIPINKLISTNKDFKKSKNYYSIVAWIYWQNYPTDINEKLDKYIKELEKNIPEELKEDYYKFISESENIDE